MMKKILGIAALVMIGGCATTRATDPGSFRSVAKARIPAAAVPRFSECLMDRFQVAHPFSQINVRQQRRAGAYRIESYAGSGSEMVLLSADLMDDGHVELFESDAAALINTKDERKAFDDCARNAA